MEYKNCPILMPCCAFPIFSRYMSSLKTMRNNTGKSKRHGYWPVDEEKYSGGNKGFIDEKYFLSR